MKREERIPYLILTLIEGDMKIPRTCSLCAWCRYARWEGSGCDECDLRCDFPVEVVSEKAYDVWAGNDCWGFKPDIWREDAVDICGLGLQGKWPDMSSVQRLSKIRRRRLKVSKNKAVPQFFYPDGIRAETFMRVFSIGVRCFES
jgi:hypothetical protein